MPGLVALVDCNNFYASCERLFQPELSGKPVVVLSNNDGCVIARSNEAKALGIKMGDAYHLRKREFAAWGVQVFSSNYTLYGDISARVMRVLSEFTPDLEVYSIDEAFLGLAGFADPERHARGLREAVGRQTGIPVCVGIAPTKTLAKVANRTAKKDPARGGVCLLDDEAAQTAALSKLALDDIWGIGGRLAPKLMALGITTPLELRAADPVMIRQRFNVVVQRTVLELRGIPCLDLERDNPEAKTICSARSFGRAVEGFDELAEALTTYVSRSAEKLRRQGLAAAAVVVLVSTNRHKPEELQYHATRHVRLTIATADTGRLIRAALYGLRGIYRPKFRYKKTGILLLDLAPAGSVQGSLFLRPDDRRRVELMGAIDAINRRYGRDRVRFAGTGLSRGWKLKAEFHSPRYTTRWDELLRV
ncbi:Y-family DNA polymerase [Methylobacterium indicum]|uniref:DNA-directed DNA polymerase n=1 Tax=Methylobacterium indicum TaxID=1775910 RepID=A0ABR5HIT7_9HYPH|nr:Y-family DNA polymerase [Methylobacterium indicum]KMO23406.1 DNA polymerase V subunit UmuC [Methylobacterium indicum]KMO26567.1 DNA polymerase V subunit UmuC [Methylobacterium indicum]